MLWSSPKSESLELTWSIPQHDDVDDFIACNGHVFQTADWAATKQSIGWTTNRLDLRVNGEISGACLLLTKRRGPLFVGMIPRGPVLNRTGGEQLLPVIIEEVRSHISKLGIGFVRITFPAGMDVKAISFGVVPARNTISHSSTFVLDLTRSAGDLLAGMEQRTRYAIRRAQKTGVEVGLGPELLPRFYGLYEVTARRAGFEPRGYRELETLVSSARARLFLTSYQGRDLAGAIVVFTKDRAWYLYGGSTRSEVAAGEYLQWNIITWAQQNGIRCYDLQGVPYPVDNNHPLYGVYMFKRGFGGTLTHTPPELDLVTPWCLRWPVTVGLAAAQSFKLAR